MRIIALTLSGMLFILAVAYGVQGEYAEITNATLEVQEFLNTRFTVFIIGSVLLSMASSFFGRG